METETIQTAPNQELLVGPEAKLLSMPNLDTALVELRGAILDNENSKLRAAKIIDAIDRQQLYRDQGFETFKAFIPKLLEQTANVGWKHSSSIKRYLGFYRLYIRQLELNPDLSMRAVSHLQELYPLAEVDRNSHELTSPDKEGKLNPSDFEDIAQLVLFLTTQMKEYISDGLDDEKTLEVLNRGGLWEQAKTYCRLAETELMFPKGGWKLEDTKNLVDKIKGVQKEDKVQLVYVGVETFDGSIHVERVEYRQSELPVWSFEVDTIVPSDVFKQLPGKKEIGGLE